MCWDACGYVASGLVLAAFTMRGMVPLRVVALLSNMAFIAYGLALGLTPVWLLHAALVPLNGCRLLEALHRQRLPEGCHVALQPRAMSAARR
jgi:hypothetical protein